MLSTKTYAVRIRANRPTWIKELSARMEANRLLPTRDYYNYRMWKEGIEMAVLRRKVDAAGTTMFQRWG